MPQGSRKQLFDRLQRYEVDGAEEVIDSYLDIAKKYELDASQLANQFVTTRDFVTSNIIGATSMDQLKLAVPYRCRIDRRDIGRYRQSHLRAPICAREEEI